MQPYDNNTRYMYDACLATALLLLVELGAADEALIEMIRWALALQAHGTKMHLLPVKEATGNLPARSDETTPVCDASV